MTRVIVRGWRRGVLQFTSCSELTSLDQAAADAFRLFAENINALLDPDGSIAPHLLEIEFPDELNPSERYFRFGTDASMMVFPIAVDSDELPTNCEQCGVLLKGGATTHKPGCPWLDIIHEFGA